MVDHNCQIRIWIVYQYFLKSRVSPESLGSETNPRPGYQWWNHPQAHHLVPNHPISGRAHVSQALSNMLCDRLFWGKKVFWHEHCKTSHGRPHISALSQEHLNDFDRILGADRSAAAMTVFWKCRTLSKTFCDLRPLSWVTKQVWQTAQIPFRVSLPAVLFVSLLYSPFSGLVTFSSRRQSNQKYMIQSNHTPTLPKVCLYNHVYTHTYALLPLGVDNPMI